jgi:RNA polymerase sigma-70 factor (ECF subfamily)
MNTQSPIRPDELLASAREGSVESLGELLQTYTSYLKLLAHTQLVTNVRVRVSPSDIVQETLLEAHRDFLKFRGRSEPEFLGWLRKILVNNLSRAVEQHLLADKRDVRREISLERLGASVERSTLRLGAVLAGNVPSPSSNAQNQENLSALADALIELAPDYRTVIILRHLEGLPFATVAERMDRTPGATRMLWLRAMDQLRERFAERGIL